MSICSFFKSKFGHKIFSSSGVWPVKVIWPFESLLMNIEKRKKVFRKPSCQIFASLGLTTLGATPAVFKNLTKYYFLITGRVEHNTYVIKGTFF